MKKATAPRPIRPKAKDATLTVDQLSIAPEHHPEFKAAMLAAARKAVDAFPQQLETVKDEMRRRLPPAALAVFATYGLSAMLANTGQKKSMVSNILQHHAEILQAIILTIPANEWGREPATPDTAQLLFDTIPPLCDTFFMQRIIDGDSIKDDREKLLVRSIQERVRLHTYGVRNWGHYQHVVQISRDLYSGLDAAMEPLIGFTASDVISILDAMIAEHERRVATHIDLLKKALRGRTPKQIFDLYYRFVTDLQGSADELLADLPKTVTREQAMGFVMAHWDLRLLDTALFETEEISAISGRPESTVRLVLDTLSLSPGALEKTNIEFLFLENPVWERPAIKIAESYFCPIPQMAFSHIHRIMDRLAEDAGFLDNAKNRRADYLEREIETVFRSALPSADVRPGVKWSWDGRQYETDLVVTVDQVVIIVEAKSHRLTPQGLRGAPDRVKRHIREIILAPSQQSARLEAIIETARTGDLIARATLAEIGIDADKTSRVIRISVTLADLAVLSAAEPDFKKLGWVPDDHDLAPSLMIADLKCVADILENEVLFLHYLSERHYLQKAFHLLGDELDFLGLYLDTGFNLSALQGKFEHFSPTGMSGPIDRFYEGTHAGLKLQKPKMKLCPLFRDTVEHLCLRKPPGWTLVGMHLLSCADPAEQKAIERNLARLRAFVRREVRDSDDTRPQTLVIRPSEERRAPVMFYLFTEGQRSRHQSVMRTIAAEAIMAGDLDACVVFSRGTERWGQAFESVVVVERW